MCDYIVKECNSYSEAIYFFIEMLQTARCGWCCLQFLGV